MTGNWVFLILPFLYLGITGALVVGAVFGIRALIRKIKRMKQSGEARFIIHFYIMIACIIIAAISWVMNFGWYRVFLTWFPIPLVHTVAFAVLIHKAVYLMSRYKRFRIYSIFSHITYLASYLLFPDGGDMGPGYVFFGLIRNDAAYSIAMPISLTCFGVNVIIMAIMAVDVIRCVCGKHDDRDDQSDVDMLQNK